MDVRKIGEVVARVIKGLDGQRTWQSHARRFLSEACRLPAGRQGPPGEDIGIYKKGQTLFLETPDPQIFYRLQQQKDRLLEHLKAHTPESGITGISVKIRSHG